MEYFRALVQEMNRYFNTADHLLYVTYPLVKDNKIIITIVENLNHSLIKAIEAILYYDRLYKRISPYPENLSSKLDVFKTKCAPRYNFNREYIILIEDINEIVEEHRRSTIEFIKKDKFVICGNSYSKNKTIDINKLKNYVNGAKPFIQKVNEIYMQNVTRRF